ncbi:MAG: hypothetical protein NTZ24_14600 [Deltaproteobacteria bacterium]|nr:hypothetical protein [Deltaproteobacteria bacterium]
MDYDDFTEAPEDYFEPSKPDHYFLQAQKEIRELYEGDRESVYYIRQIQIKFEKKYYHWITNNAIIGLNKIGYLKDVRIPKERGTPARFFIHKANRYARRTINRMEKVIDEYSQDHITRSCGHRAEDLFCNALAMRGFLPKAKKVKEFNDKKWEKTGHDLDFVFSRDGVAYGCEIKNTLGYIDKEELEVKLEMCAYFGIKPLFIMRYSPKTYNNMIYENGGFALIFETQIYELSQEKLVKEIKDVLGLPVICSKAIPDGIIDRFETWHNRSNV